MYVAYSVVTYLTAHTCVASAVSAGGKLSVDVMSNDASDVSVSVLPWLGERADRRRPDPLRFSTLNEPVPATAQFMRYASVGSTSPFLQQHNSCATLQ